MVKTEYDVSPVQLKERLKQGDDLVLLDVREPYEYEMVNIGGLLMPLSELPRRYHELDPEREIVVHCHVGHRSLIALRFLVQAGFRNVKNLEGGIDRWAREVDPSVKRY
jgi:adenylyltransferase/sulfurtransferase